MPSSLFEAIRTGIGPALALSMRATKPMAAPKKEQSAQARPAYLYHQDRSIEFLCAGVMLGWSLVMALPGDSLALSSLAPLRKLGFTEAGIAGLYGIVGVLRFLALHFNGGLLPKSPIYRLVGAWFGVFLFSQVSLVLVVDWWVSGVAKTGLTVYPLLVLAELFTCFRAASDTRYARTG